MPTIPYFFDQCFDKKRIQKLILWSLNFQGENKTLELIEELKNIGFRFATSSGVSLSIDDLKTPPKKQLEVLETERLILQNIQASLRGNRTAIETLQTVIDTWHRTSETVKDHVVEYFEATNILNPVYMMAFSGARGNVSQVRQLVGMRGLMADPKGNIIDFPIRSNFREGLTITEYMISCYGARKGVVDTALRTADAGYLTRRLVDVAQHIIVQQVSCGTLRGMEVQPLVDNGQTLLSLRERLVGRVLAKDVFAGTTCLGKRNEPINESLATQLSQHAEDTRFDLKARQIFVRSPLTCELYDGVCQFCYGWSLAQHRMVTLGEAVGVIAGQSIGEPGTQLTMRTFHTGGVFTGEVQKEFRAPHGGVIQYNSMFPGLLVRTPYGQIAFLVKAPGTMTIYDPKTQRQTQLTIPTHMALFLRQGETVRNNQILGLPREQAARTNEQSETRKIVFSEFPGEVVYQNVQMKKIPIPIPISRRHNKALQERLKLLRPPTKPKKKKKRQSYLAKQRPRKTYIVTNKVGTVWILAGASIGNAETILPIYRTSGQVVETSTILSRHAILQPFDGLVKSQTSMTKAPPKEVLSNLAMQRLIPGTGPTETHTRETQQFLFQPLFDGIAHHIHISRQGQTVAFQSEKDLFLWPFGLPQQHLTSTLFRPLNFQTQRTLPYLNPWQEVNHRKRKRPSQLTCLYYHHEYRFPSSSGYFWSLPLYADSKKMHGHGFVVQQIKPISSLSTTVQMPWVETAGQERQPAFLTPGFWYQKGRSLRGTENLQGQPHYTTITQSGFFQAPKEPTVQLKFPDTTSERLERFQVNPRGTVLFSSNLPSFKKNRVKTVLPKTQNTVKKGRSADQKSKKIRSTSHVLMLDSNLWTCFPFLAKKQTLPEGEFRAGWGYLPNFRDTIQKPEFFEHTVLEDPIFLYTETKNLHPQLYQEHTLWDRLQLPSHVEWTTDQCKTKRLLELRALRQNALARHPHSFARLRTSVQQGIYQLVCQTQVLTFTQSSMAYLMIAPHDQLQTEISRLAATLSDWSVSPLCPSLSTMKNWSLVIPSLPKKGRRVSRKTRKDAQQDYTTRNQVHVKIPRRYKKRNQSLFFTTQYLATLYRPVHEYPLERLHQTHAKIAAYQSLENCQRNLQRIPITPEITDRRHPSQANLYEAFVWHHRSLLQSPRGLTSSEHVWIKQVASRLMPHRRANKVRMKPFLLPSQTFFTATTGFGCRFVIETTPPTQRAEIRLIFEKPWSTLHGHSVGTSRWSIGFGEKPRMHSTYDDFIHSDEALLLHGDLLIRRRIYHPDAGETLISASKKCLVLREEDLHTYILDAPKLNVCIGDFVRYGDEIAPGIGLPESGQIIAMTPTSFLVRRGQPIFFYESGALHVQAKAWIPRGHPLVTLSYQRLITGDIVQGIPKVERFFEGSNSAESESLPLLLRNTFYTLKKTAFDAANPKKKKKKKKKTASRGPTDILTLLARARGRFVRGARFSGKKKPVTKKPDDTPFQYAAFQQSIALIQQKIIENIQKVYLSQGVNIDDKHFEIIVKQMTSSVKIIDPGDTGLFRNEILPMARVEKVNAGMFFGNLARYEPVIVGISRKAVNAESFLSAASFQETSRVLARDAIAGKTDFLKGLKERVIIGDLIPAGTGVDETIIASDQIVPRLSPQAIDHLLP